MTEGASTSSEREPFDKVLLVGLGWGVLGATVSAGIIGIALTIGGTFVGASFWDGLSFSFVAMVYVFMGAVLTAIVPVGPTAALLAWPLYRLGVRARWAYAVAGAAAAVTVPASFAALSTALPPLINWSDLRSLRLDSAIIFGYFLIIGGFAGFMAGRYVRRTAING